MPFITARVGEHVDGAQLGINTQLLRQVTERLAYCILFFENVDPIQKVVPQSGSCRVAMVRISVLLPAPFGPNKPNM
jgi:hypothetical protein